RGRALGQQFGDGNVVRHDLAVDPRFADPARDELGVLGAEVDDENQGGSGVHSATSLEGAIREAGPGPPARLAGSVRRFSQGVPAPGRTGVIPGGPAQGREGYADACRLSPADGRAPGRGPTAGGRLSLCPAAAVRHWPIRRRQRLIGRPVTQGRAAYGTRGYARPRPS